MSVFTQLRRHTYIASVLVLALVLWATGIPGMVLHAEAANLKFVSDTISDSDPGMPSNHTIQFTTPTGINPDETVAVTFPAGFTNIANIYVTDVDFGSSTTDFTLVAGAPSGASWGFATSGQTLILTNGNTAVASGSALVLRIGTNATIGGAGANRIINHASAVSHEIHIGGTMDDSGYTRIAMIDDVVVTASVPTTFTFTIAGVAIGQTVNQSPTTTATTTTATAIPFGIIQPNLSYTAAQDLFVSTNARNGFVVTLIQDQNLTSASGADIDKFIDNAGGTGTASPTDWVAPLNTLGSEDTYGHFAFTSDDADLNSDEFDASGNGDLWAGNLSATVPRQVFSHNGPANGVAQNIGRARVGFQIGIGALQEAGNDYTNTLTYVATPTF